MSLGCPNCGSADIETDAARGDAVCIQCGTVIEENAIVNEVTFAQDAGGGSSVVGQFVATSSGLGFGKESREVAFTNGQRHISQLAQALRLAEHHQEAAQRLFMLAVQHNFIQGRRTQHVIAACLYTVCRREKTPHLLIDFSDVLQTNVYLLGSCFLKFTRLLSLALPIIDPSLYIHRFASKLEFGDKTHLVSMCALRLVQRMKRDWIQTGRRPSGICGAALLIAARVHGFRRTQREVVRVVRICDVTLRRRLTEFAETPMGALTARELDTVDIEALPAADPPSFTRNRLAEDAQERGALEMSDAAAATLEPPPALIGPSVRTLPFAVGDLAASPRANGCACDAERRHHDHAAPSEMSHALSDRSVVEDAMGVGGTRTYAGMWTGGGGLPTVAIHDARGDGDRDAQRTPSAWSSADLLSSREEQLEGESAEAQQALMDELNEDLAALDTEVEGYLIMDAQEVEIKTRVWEQMNRDYEQALADKARDEVEKRTAHREERGGSELALLAEGPRRPLLSKRQRRESAAWANAAPGSVADAVAGELRRNKLSSRINYDIVQILSQTLDEDAERMPTVPGLILDSAGAPRHEPLDPELQTSSFSEALQSTHARGYCGLAPIDDSSETAPSPVTRSSVDRGVSLEPLY